MSTYVLPAEVFPTAVRSTCFGLCAGMGKLGALLGSASFESIQRAIGLDGVYWVRPRHRARGRARRPARSLRAFLASTRRAAQASRGLAKYVGSCVRTAQVCAAVSMLGYVVTLVLVPTAQALEMDKERPGALQQTLVEHIASTEANA